MLECDALEKQLCDVNQKRREQRVKFMVLAVASVCVFLLIWQLIVISGVVNVRNLPSPAQIFKAFITKLTSKSPDGNTLGMNILASLQVSLTGFFAALIIGVPLGLLMGWFEPVDRFVRPIFELIRPIPPIAWIPVVVIFMGIGIQAKATIIFLAVFVSCGAGNVETFFKIGIPSAMPMVFAGIRVSLGSAWSTLVAAEMLAAHAGLGYMLQTGRNVGKAEIVVLAMVTIAALGAVMSGLLTLIERRVLKWKMTR